MMKEKKLLKNWIDAYGSKIGFIISQNPSRKMDKIVDDCFSICDLGGVFFYSTPNDFLKYSENIENAINIAKKYDSRLVATTIGFESFNDEDLKTFRKPTTKENNIRTINKLRELRNDYTGHFEYIQPFCDHGLIPFLPWRDLESIANEFYELAKLEAWDVFSPISLHIKLDVKNYNEELYQLLKKCKEEKKIEIVGINEFGVYVWKYSDPEINETRKLLIDYAKKYFPLRNQILNEGKGKRVGKFINLSFKSITGYNIGLLKIIF